MLKKLPALIAIFLFAAIDMASAQVAKTVIVEHFTNTRCGICSNRNPGFYTNLENHPQVLHLSVHPSAPYSNCALNLNNPSENDDRTNYYGIYGSTPKLVIQGNNIPASTNYGNASIFEPYLEQTSPVSIDIQQTKENNIVSATITLTVEAEHNLLDMNLFVALAEDSVFYDAPNGEDLHEDVYRKNMSEIADGFVVNLPATVGESVSFEVSTEASADWDFNRLYLLAILQNSDSKEVAQSAAVSPDMNVMPPSSNEDVPSLEGISIFPNPAKNLVNITLEDNALTQAKLYDAFGRLVSAKEFQNQMQLDLSSFSAGIYLLELENENGKSVERVILK